MENKSKTLKQMFEEIIEEVTMYNTPHKDEIITFCNGRLAQLENKKTSRKPTKEDLVNMERKEVILEVLASANEPITIVTMQDMDARLAEVNSYSLVGLLTSLKKQGKVVSVEKKRKTYYSLVSSTPVVEDTEEEEEEN